MMKKIMMIGLVVCGGVQGIQGMSRKPAIIPPLSRAFNISALMSQAQRKQASLESQRISSNTGYLLKAIEHLYLPQRVNQQSPRSWVPRPETPRIKFKDTLTRQPVHHDIAALYQV